MALFQPLRVGRHTLANRVVMAPLTRGRATEKNVPTEMQATYYQQRASAGLIVSEATFISQQGVGWWRAPGVFREDQVAAWKKVTEAVHARNGKIALQLWHMGRQGHSSLSGEPTVSASAIAVKGDVRVAHGKKVPYEVPRALETDEVPEIVKQYGVAAQNAIDAGFDYVEVHSANGYLLDQFLQTVSNNRTDRYGGSLENRVRFLSEVLEEVTRKVGADRVGVRFSPNGVFGDMGSEDNIETFTEAIRIASKNNLAYIHVMDGLGFGFHEKTKPFTLEMVRKVVTSTQGDNVEVPTAVMGSTGHTQESATQEIEAGHADFVSFGRPYIANPDLVERFKHNLALADHSDMTYWYSGEEQGYTTYPNAARSEDELNGR